MNIDKFNNKIQKNDQQENQVGGQTNSTHQPSYHAFK